MFRRWYLWMCWYFFLYMCICSPLFVYCFILLSFFFVLFAHCSAISVLLFLFYSIDLGSFHLPFSRVGLFKFHPSHSQKNKCVVLIGITFVDASIHLFQLWILQKVSRILWLDAIPHTMTRCAKKQINFPSCQRPIVEWFRFQPLFWIVRYLITYFHKATVPTHISTTMRYKQTKT